MEVKLNDKVIGQAAVIEGTSYLPVRALANEFQLDVAVNTTTITLTSPSAEENAKEAQQQQDESDKATKIKTLTSQIELSKHNIEEFTKGVETAEKKVSSAKLTYDEVMANPNASKEFKDNEAKRYELVKQALDNIKSLLSKEQAKLADLEAQLTALQQS
jgi:chromosome segregation ATPase